MNQTPIDQIFDENNTDPVVLYNENGQAVSFEQIALIPMNDRVYVILKPTQPMEGVGEDEGFVFEIVLQDQEETLVIVEDFSIINAVFDIYDDFVADANNN